LEQQNPYIIALKEAIGYNPEMVTFLHNTMTRENAETIMNKGFRFYSHLDYTTDVVSAKDDITITYFNLVRSAYGPFTIIIQMDKELIQYYSDLLLDRHNHFSELLTLEMPEKSNDEEWIYTLAPNFVKGYVDSRFPCFFPNSKFNPSLKHPEFEKNLQHLRNH
jgi:hypothetical protein